MSEEILINVTPREVRVAVVENGVLQELYLERSSKRGLVGNIYKGRVNRVLPGMQAAFIDIGLDRAAFLHASDIAVPRPLARNDESGLLVADEPASSEAVTLQPPLRRADDRRVEAITSLLKEGQEILVQVIKDPLGTKGARLSTQISIPSRYLVFLPGERTIGVSQKIEAEEERQRLKDIMQPFLAEDIGGFIIRTAAEGAAAEALRADVDFFRKVWAEIQVNARIAIPDTVVYEDLPLPLRALRDLVHPQIEKIRVDSRETHRRLVSFAEKFIPDMAARIEHYPGERPIFDLYSIEDEIQKALQRKVQLKSGGYLIIDQTEAMTTIDVNTGAFVGHRNLEETIFKTNLEAAQSIARQLRLRNLGGIIIIDFIDMTEEEHRRQVLRSLEKSLERDHAKSHISGVSALGLVEMTRKRTRESLEHILCEPCPTCQGRASLKTTETICYEIFREILRAARQFEAQQLLILVSREVAERLLDEESSSVAELEEFTGRLLKFQVESLYLREQFDVVLI